VRSAAALIKQGYQPSGRLEREEIKNGVHRAGLMFDVKRDEWLAAREAWQAKRAAAVS
jgi:RimJ/RimL family protein N-acetyltransferase